jgi:hypothetical protein
MARTAAFDVQFHVPVRWSGILKLIKSGWDEWRKYRNKVMILKDRDLELGSQCRGLEAIWHDVKPLPCLRPRRHLLDDNPCSG